MIHDRILTAARRGFDHELRGLLDRDDARAALALHPHLLREAALLAASTGQDRVLDVLFDYGLGNELLLDLHAITSLAERRWATRALGLRQRVHELGVLPASDRRDAAVADLFVELLQPSRFAEFDLEERERSEDRRIQLALQLVHDHGRPRIVGAHAPALKVAVLAHADEVIRALLAHGADPAERDADGRSVLWHAGWTRSAVSFRLLCTAWPGAVLPEDVAARESLPPVDGVHNPASGHRNPFFVERDHENPVIDLMLEAGISWSLDWACARAEPDVVRTLLTAGSDASAPNENGVAPLVIAAGWEADDANRATIVDMLLEAGALDRDDGRIRAAAAHAARMVGRTHIAARIETCVS
jgi:hypothetical protein